MRFLITLSASALLLSATAQAQFWNTAQDTATQSVLKGFSKKGNTLTRAGTTITLDTVAGRVVGVLADAPLVDSDGVARAILASWGGSEKGLPQLKKLLDNPQFRTGARQGFLDTTSEEGTHILAAKVSGQGAAARWQVYSALNILPESTFPSTRNVTGNAAARPACTS